MRCVANCAMRVVSRSIPPVFSSNDVRTVTPLTIMITLQGIASIAGFSIGHSASVRMTARTNAPIPTWIRKPTTATTRSAIDPSVVQCRHVIFTLGALLVLSVV